MRKPSKVSHTFAAVNALQTHSSVCTSSLHISLHVHDMNVPVQIAMGFKGQQVLKDVSWECKKGERVGLVGGCPAMSIVCITPVPIPRTAEALHKQGRGHCLLWLCALIEC